MSDHAIRKIDDASYALTAISRILTDINEAKSSDIPEPEWYNSEYVIGGLNAAIAALSGVIQAQAEVLERNQS